MIMQHSKMGGTLPNNGMDINDLIDPRPWNEKPVERLSIKEIEEHWDEFPPETREAIKKMLNREKEQFQKIVDQNLGDTVSPRFEKPFLPSIPDAPHFSLPEAFAELQAALDKVLENQEEILKILKEFRK